MIRQISCSLRANSRRWPRYVRLLEYKLRHREIVDGITPYQLVHGFHGSIELSTALGALRVFLQYILISDWLRGIIAETKEFESRMPEHWIVQAEARMRKHEEQSQAPRMMEGDLVLIAKPFYERGTGTILPQSDGPYVVSRLPNTHTAILEDPFSGELFQAGRPVALARLTRFQYPLDWMNEYDNHPPQDEPLSDILKVGDFVALEPYQRYGRRIYVGRIQTIHHEQGLLEVHLCHIPRDSHALQHSPILGN